MAKTSLIYEKYFFGNLSLRLSTQSKIAEYFSFLFSICLLLCCRNWTQSGWQWTEENLDTKLHNKLQLKQQKVGGLVINPFSYWPWYHIVRVAYEQSNCKMVENSCCYHNQQHFNIWGRNWWWRRWWIVQRIGSSATHTGFRSSWFSIKSELPCQDFKSFSDHDMFTTTLCEMINQIIILIILMNTMFHLLWENYFPARPGPV